jgi:hypothetical protein
VSTYTAVRNEIQTSRDESQILPIELIHKNSSAGEFIEFESAVVECLTFTDDVRQQSLYFRFHRTSCRTVWQYF